MGADKDKPRMDTNKNQKSPQRHRELQERLFIESSKIRGEEFASIRGLSRRRLCGGGSIGGLSLSALICVYLRFAFVGSIGG
jgi:hypothetical protein